MEYTISKLARLAGISTRTLRYYDKINLLKPARINSSGYRMYSQYEVDRLQQILFFRELDVDLETIASIMNDPHFDHVEALIQHHKKLLQRRSRLDQLIKTIEKTIAHEKGGYSMTNKEKFEVFKEKAIQDNEEKYGEEVRQKFGEKIFQTSTDKFRQMTEDDFNAMHEAEQKLFNYLKQANGDPASEFAQKAAAKHKEWLSFTWPHYSKEAHRSLAAMYLADERFKSYYDKSGAGTAQLLHDAICIYTGYTEEEK